MAITTKSQWVKDLLGNKTFAWSHVKTVFYNRAKNILLKDKLDQIDAAISKQNSDLAYFKNGYISSGAELTPDSSMLSGLQEIYAGLPDNHVYEILASFSGAMVHLSGLKVSSQYGYIVSRSYAEAANKRYDITNGVWTANAQ